MTKRKAKIFLALLIAVTVPASCFATVSAGTGYGAAAVQSVPPDAGGGIREDPDPFPYPTEESCESVESDEQAESLYARTTDNGDGTKTLEVFGTPVKYVAEDGSVRDISLRLIPDGSGFRTEDHYILAEFPEKAGTGISLNTGEYTVTLTPAAEDGSPVETEPALLTDPGTVFYRKDSRTGYEYSITYSGYKENIVVSEYTGQTDFFFLLETDGLELFFPDGKTAGTGLALRDADNNVIANLGDVIVFTADDRNNTPGNISFETVTERNEYLLCVSVSGDYLSDPATHYPIRIDPSIEVSYSNNGPGAIEDVTVCSQIVYGGDTTFLFAGKNSAGALHRCFFRFPSLNVSGLDIVSANLYIRDLLCEAQSIPVECHEYTGTTWTESGGLSWSVASNGIGQLLDSKNIYYGNGVQGGNWYAFDITSLAEDWADGTASPAKGVLLKSSSAYESGNTYGYKTIGSYNRPQNKPYLTITYNSTMTISQSTANVLVGNGFSLTAQTSPSGLTVTWSSSNTAVATVTQYGYVSAKSTGSAVITASASGASAECEVTVTALSGVYRIQNLDNYKYLTDGGNFEPDLCNLSSSSRSQMWLIKNIGGTSKYTLNPLSKTTFSYTGTDIGLVGGLYEDDIGVYTTGISNGSTTLSYGEWYITGNAVSGFRIVSYAADDYDILVRNSSGNGVELEYDENLIDEEDPVDLWNITLQSSISYTALSSSVNSLSSFQSGKLNWLSFITSVNSNAADQRAVFHSMDSSKVAVSPEGIISVNDNCPDSSSVQITASCGSNTISVTVSTSAYESFFWNEDYYAEKGTIQLDGRVVWLDKQDNALLCLSGTNGLTFSAFNSNSFNHEWLLIGSGKETQLKNIESGLVLKVNVPTDGDGSTVELSTKTNSSNEFFCLERIDDGNRYIITTKSSGYTCALAYNSNTGSIYQTNRINTQVLLKFRIREGGSSTLPSGYYCMGNPYGTSYFYLTADTNTARLDLFSRTADYPRWLLMYKGKGDYSIIDEPGQYGKALQYDNGDVRLENVSGYDDQLWQCIVNADYSFSFKAKGQNDYLMRDATWESTPHPVIADSSPVSTEANWKMVQVTDSDARYNYGIVADVALIGIEDTTHQYSHLTWMAYGMDKLYDKRNMSYPILYNSVSIRYCFQSGMSSGDYLDLITKAKLIIHRGHGDIDPNSSILLLTPRNNNGYIGSSISFSGSLLNSNDLDNCECVLFLSCRSGGFSNTDFSSSLVSKAVDEGAKLAIGICGVGDCSEINWFLDEYLLLIGQSGSNSSPNYYAAFNTILLEIDNINAQSQSPEINTIFVCRLFEAEN